MVSTYRLAPTGTEETDTDPVCWFATRVAYTLLVAPAVTWTVVEYGWYPDFVT
jgi:hypothetical protein